VLGGGQDFVVSSSENVFTYSGDARWHFLPDNMLYARIAEGFVPGGPNDVTPTDPNISHTYQASTTLNYELGLKSALLNDHLTAEISVYWHKIQLEASIGGLRSFTNGGTAQSKGVEWNFVYAPLAGLNLGFNGAYTDAYLTAPTPSSLNGQIGDRLPSSPLWETSTSASYERPLFSNYPGFVGFNWRFNASRYGDFENIGPRQKMPGFDIFDLRAGLKTDNWTVALYVKNIGNALAISYVRDETLADGLGAQSGAVYTPRTIGITLSANL